MILIVNKANMKIAIWLMKKILNKYNKDLLIKKIIRIIKVIKLRKKTNDL